MLFETERLFFREMTLEDTDTLALVMSDPESMKFYPHPLCNRAGRKKELVVCSQGGPPRISPCLVPQIQKRSPKSKILIGKKKRGGKH